MVMLFLKVSCNVLKSNNHTVAILTANNDAYHGKDAVLDHTYADPKNGFSENFFLEHPSDAWYGIRELQNDAMGSQGLVPCSYQNRAYI